MWVMCLRGCAPRASAETDPVGVLCRLSVLGMRVQASTNENSPDSFESGLFLNLVAGTRIHLYLLDVLQEMPPLPVRLI